MAAERKPTPEQQDAIRHRGSTCVLTSGAGCGKTTVLTNRYLSLLEDGLSVSQIVAITFTDRAAREMRRRIREEIGKRIESTTDGDDREKWVRHRNHLDAASIQTIHSFCANLIADHATELEFGNELVTLDEPSAVVMRNRSIRETLDRLVLAEGPAAADLRELIVLYGAWNVNRIVNELLPWYEESAWRAFQSRSVEAIASHWQSEVRVRLQPLWIDYLAHASPGIVGMFRLIDTLSVIPESAARTFAEIRERFAGLRESRQLANDIEMLHELAKVKSVGAKKQWANEGDYELVRDAMSDFRDVLKSKFEAFSNPDAAQLHRAIEIGQRVIRVADACQADYQRAKRDARAIDFGDQIALARSLLAERDDIRRRISDSYSAILVDEFQDTDPMQMEIVNALANRDRKPEKLFVVGDEKQAIYGFRGADVSLFRQLRNQVPPSGQLALRTNYRSRPGLIRFVNLLFEKRLSHYEPLSASRPESLRESDVEFLWSFPEEAGGEESADDVRSREAKVIAGRIDQLVREGSIEIPASDGKPARPVALRDIVLLFRSMSHVAIYERALQSYGIDYYLIGGRAFYAQQEVYDLLNVLKAIENPLDGIALVGVLRSPFCGLSDNTVTLLATHADGIWSGLFDEAIFPRIAEVDQPLVRQARVNLTNWRSRKDRLPMRELFDGIIAETGYDAALQFEPLADRKLANLWKLLDFVRTFDRTETGPARFQAFLDALVSHEPREEEAATRPEDDNVVRIMSIHQAKGLEFPIVFVPDLAGEKRSGKSDTARWHREMGLLVRRPGDIQEDDAESFSEWPVKLAACADELAEWQEELRVMYVVCTRAKELLILSSGWREPFAGGSPTPIPKRGSNHATTMLAERFDLRTGQCLVPGVPITASVSVTTNVSEPDAPNSASHPKAEMPSVWMPKPPGDWVRELPETISLLEWPVEAGLHRLAFRVKSAWSRWDATEQLPADSPLQFLVTCGVLDRIRSAISFIKDWEYGVPLPPGQGRRFASAIRGSVPIVLVEPKQVHLMAFEFGESERSRLGLRMAAIAANDEHAGKRIVCERIDVSKATRTVDAFDPVQRDEAIREFLTAFTSLRDQSPPR